jgi:hypothetical protein
MKVKKAQVGKSLPKKKAVADSVESEMNPGKMIPKEKSNYATGKIGKMIESGKTKPAAPKKKMKNGGKSFPDLNKDGKITKADILKGRGVIAKSGKKVSKQSKKK